MTNTNTGKASCIGIAMRHCLKLLAGCLLITSALAAHAGLLDSLGSILRGDAQNEASTTQPQKSNLSEQPKAGSDRGAPLTTDSITSTNSDKQSDADHADVFVQIGHSGSVLALAVSPDGRTIVSGSADRSLKLWDVASGRELRTLNGSNCIVLAVAFSPDGRTIVSGGIQAPLKLWDVASGRELLSMGKHPSVNSVAFSPDGRTIVSGGSQLSGSDSNTLRLWDAASGRELKTLSNTFIPHDVNAVAFSPNGQVIASGGKYDKSLKLWDAESGQNLQTLSGHAEEVHAVAFSPNGNTIVTASKDKSLKLWDVVTGRELKTLSGHSDAVTSVAFSPNGKTIVSGSNDKSIRLWDAESGLNLHTVTGDGLEVSATTYFPNGKTIVSGGRGKTLTLWDVTSLAKVNTLGGNGNAVDAVAISPDGKTIVSSFSWNAQGERRSALNFWEAATGIKQHTFDVGEGRVRKIVYSPNGLTLATHASGKRSAVELWDAASGKKLQTLNSHIFDGNLAKIGASSFAFSPDGQQIASAIDSHIEFWDIGRAQISHSTAKSNIGASVAYSPDGRTIATDCWQDKSGCIKFFDVASGRQLPTKIRHGSNNSAVAFSPDGQTIASGGPTSHANYNIKLWDAASGRELRTLNWFKFTSDSDFESKLDSTTKMFRQVPNELLFSPDGRTLASKHGSTIIKLWDVASGSELRTLGGNGITISTMTFSPNGKYVIYGSDDGAFHQVDVKAGMEVAQFASFSDGEWATIIAEGYYNSSPSGHKSMNVRMGNKVNGIDQFYDVFYRPDIVLEKLKGKDISGLITVTIDDALKSPPPVVVFTTIPESTALSRAKVCYKATSTGGGIGEVRLFQNGKLIKSDGFYREAAVRRADENLKLAQLNGEAIHRNLQRISNKKAEPPSIADSTKGNIFDECQQVETSPGENEISATAFNAQNTIQSKIETVRFTSNRKPEEPHLYVLAIGIDKYRDPSITLHFAAKDAKDFRAMIQKRAGSLFKPQNVHIEGLYDGAANKEGIDKAIKILSGKVKPWDSFMLFVASHGVLLENQYYIVTSGFNGSVNRANLISSNEIVGMSKNIKSLSQLFIFDTCHAGGVDNIVSGLYDARMSVMAKKMGLHVFASAGSVQQAIDGYKGNGLFTHTLLNSMRDAEATDINKDKQVSVVELGQRARKETGDISKSIGHSQTPFIINFGKDAPLFSVQ